MQKEREQEAENQQDSDESESGSGLENRTLGFNTPPDSPNAIAQFIREHSLQYEGERILYLHKIQIDYFGEIIKISLNYLIILYIVKEL